MLVANTLTYYTLDKITAKNNLKHCGKVETFDFKITNKLKLILGLLKKLGLNEFKHKKI